MTSNNTGMQLNIAINYGGRSDILHSVKKISKLIETKKMTSDNISEKTIQENLISSCVLNFDLLIRTSGEKDCRILCYGNYAIPNYIFAL